MDQIIAAKELYQGFQKVEDYYAKFDTPFPIGVFGTLRRLPDNQGNANRMFTREPVVHKKAFLPHFASSGIWLNFKEGASGVLELYYYTPQDFPAVIERVDALEGFSPDHSYGYWRTLVEVRVLPDDYEHELFETGIRVDDRDLRIPEEEWINYPTSPAWVYSNAKSNHACQICFSGDSDLSKQSRTQYDSPVLWWH